MTKAQKNKLHAAFDTIQESLREAASEACTRSDPYAVHGLMKELFAMEARKRTLANRFGLGKDEPQPAY